MSTALSVSLPTTPPSRITRVFSRMQAHPHPMPNHTPVAHAHIQTSARVEKEVQAKREKEELRHAQTISRGAGFSVQPVQSTTRSARPGSATGVRAHVAPQDSEVAAVPRRASTGATLVIPRAAGSAGSAASPLPLAGAASPAAAITSPGAAAAAAAASPTLMASEAAAALAKAGFARSPQEVDSIYRWVRSLSIEFFTEVDEPTLRLLCARIHSREFARRDVVMREGTVADALFIMVAGSVSIYNESFRDHEAVDALIQSNQSQPTLEGQPRNLAELIVLLGGKPKLITTIHSTPASRPAFGELGLLSEQLRTATVIAEGGVSAPTSFLIIDKADFDQVLKRRQQEAFSEKIDVLKQLRVFSTVSERQLVKISIYFEERVLTAGSIIFEQGSVADCVTFLVKGECEITETITLASGGHATQQTERVHLGLIGAGELISDAAVFDTPLLHPWEVSSRTPVTLYCISNEEFTKRIKADLLVQIRRMSFAKKQLRDQLRSKAHRTNKKLYLQSPRIKQAHKLLAQVSCEKQGSSTPALPRKIRDTFLKNVVSAARTVTEIAAQSHSRPSTTAATTHPSLTVRDGQASSTNSSIPPLRPSTSPMLSAAGGASNHAPVPPSPTKGSLLVQRNPFAYDHTIASLSANTPGAAPAVPTTRPNSSRSSVHRGGGLTSIASNTPRMEYPFDHVHFSEGVVSQPSPPLSPALFSLASPSPLSPQHGPNHGRRPRARQHSISMQLGPGNTLSVSGLSDGAVHTITEDDTIAPLEPPSPFSPNRRAPAASIVHSQIHGHQRHVSTHRGSIVSPSSLPFAVEATAPDRMREHRPSISISEAASHIAAPVLIMPGPDIVVNSALVPGALPTLSEPLAPVPSFAHMPIDFYQLAPEKQYGYSRGPGAYKRPSISIVPGSLAAAAIAANANSSGVDGGQGAGSLGFQKPSIMSPGGGEAGLPGSPAPAAMLRRLAVPRLSLSARNDPTLLQTGSPLPTPLSLIHSESSSPSSSAAPSRQVSRHSSMASLHAPRPPTSAVPPAAPVIAAAARAVTTHHSGTAPQRSVPAAMLACVSDDEDVELDRIDATGVRRTQTRNQALLENTAAALLLDPLLLQKENRKWDRQLSGWHRKLVVASSSFITRNGRPLDTSLDPTTSCNVLALTPANVDVFTTRTDLTPTQMASPLSLLPCALAPATSLARSAIPYLYPTTRETGSMSQTRALTSALSNLQDAISSGFSRTASEQVALNLEQSELAKRHAEAELALKRLSQRMRPEDELIRRRHYISRSLRAKVSTKQAERRQRMFVEESEADALSARRRRKDTDVGLESRKSPEQRAIEKVEREAAKKERDEAKEAYDAQRAEELKYSPRRAPSLERTTEQKDEEDETSSTHHRVAFAEPPVLPAPAAALPPMPLPADQQLSEDSVEYKAIAANEHEAVLLSRMVATLDDSGDMFLRDLLQTDDERREVHRKKEQSKKRAASPTKANNVHRRSMTTADDKKESSDPFARIRFQIDAVALQTPTTPGSPMKGALTPQLGTPNGLTSSASTPRLTPGHSPTIAPLRTRDQRVLHTGVLELEQDRELDYGVRWNFFEDRASSTRAEHFERLHSQGGGDAQKAMRSSRPSVTDLHAAPSKVQEALERNAQVADPHATLTPAEVSHNQLVAAVRRQDLRQRDFEKQQASSLPDAQTVRPLIALTQHDVAGDARLLGAAAPRLYHWTAMNASGPGSARGSTEMKDLLSEESLRQCLHQPVPHPPLPAGPPVRAETLAELNSEIAHYRRDMRLLRNITSPFDAAHRAHGLQSQAAYAEKMKQRLQRDMVGVKLRKNNVVSSGYPSGSATSRPSTSKSSLSQETELAPKRFWRQSFQKERFSRQGILEYARKTLPYARQEDEYDNPSLPYVEREEKSAAPVEASDAAPLRVTSTLISQLLAPLKATAVAATAVDQPSSVAHLPVLGGPTPPTEGSASAGPTPPSPPAGLLPFTPAMLALVRRSAPPLVNVLDSTDEMVGRPPPTYASRKHRLFAVR